MKRQTKIHLINGAFWLSLAALFTYHLFGGKSIPRDYRSLFGNGEKTGGQPAIIAEPDSKEIDDSGVLPEQALNRAPFVSQAPYANWDAIHEETCEEAAIIIAHFYRKGRKELSADEAEKELMAMVRYQEEHYGGAHDITAQEIAKLAVDFYGEDGYEIITSFALADLKQYISRGNLIIVPAAGRVLENPNFKQPGPLYHVLVITGYDDKKQQFITNDPGTRKGFGFRYSYKNLMESIHDFPGEKEKILEGNPAAIIVWK